MSVVDPARKTLVRQYRVTIRSLRFAMPGVRYVLASGVLFFVLMVSVVGIPLVAGYISKCIVGVLNGEKKPPDVGDLTYLYKSGLVVCLLGVEYFIIAWLIVRVVVLAFSPETLTQLGHRLFYISSGFGVDFYLKAFVIGLLWNSLLSNAWFRYLVDGRLLSAMNPASMIKWVVDRPKMVFNNVLSGGMLGITLAFFSIPVITTPWMTIIGLLSNAYIRADSYKRLHESGDLYKHTYVEFFRGRLKAIKEK